MVCCGIFSWLGSNVGITLPSLVLGSIAKTILATADGTSDQMFQLSICQSTVFPGLCLACDRCPSPSEP